MIEKKKISVHLHSDNPPTSLIEVRQKKIYDEIGQKSITPRRRGVTDATPLERDTIILEKAVYNLHIESASVASGVAS